MMDCFEVNSVSKREVCMKKIKKLCAERGIVDMEESMIELDYAIILTRLDDEGDTFWNNLEKFEESVEIPPSSPLVCQEGNAEEMSKTAKEFSGSESSVVEIHHMENIKQCQAKYGEEMLSKCETGHKDEVEVEIIDIENIPFHEDGYNPFILSKCYETLGEASGEDSNLSRFRKKLTDLLKMSYDEKEFRSLWRTVNEKKPVQGSVNLRGGYKQYPTNVDGNSYLDWYEDLRKKIDEFRPDEHRILHILRGFFFWLKNIPHGGTFKPWLDTSYLKALELECSRNSLNCDTQFKKSLC